MLTPNGSIGPPDLRNWLPLCGLIACLLSVTGCPIRPGRTSLPVAVRAPVRAPARVGGPTGSPTRVEAVRAPASASLKIASSLKIRFKLPPRASIRLRSDGVIDALNSGGRRLKAIARVNPNGEIWVLSRRGRPTKHVARVLEDGTVWEVDAFGNPWRMVGSIRATVRGSSVDIRYEPSSLSEIIGHLRAGDTLRVCGHAPGWYFIRHKNGITGWVAAATVTAMVDWNSLGDSDSENEEHVSRPPTQSPTGAPLEFNSNPFGTSQSGTQTPALAPIQLPGPRNDPWWEQEQARRREQARQEAEDRARRERDIEKRERHEEVDRAKRVIEHIINRARQRP